MKLHCLYFMHARAKAERRDQAVKRLSRAIDRRISVIGGWS